MSKFPQFHCLSEFKFKIDDLVSSDRFYVLKSIYIKYGIKIGPHVKKYSVLTFHKHVKGLIGFQRKEQL